ncbi:MotA/TolQ/ExbB proton channel family protein [Akkermansiaceae bacterium]|nr:MotA/TolQ/ExbB proton channel family protein [Akkermansiaceae bacterium]MDB4297845.1 MotA/TolQ/ExbB proton channel family protein [bacterium]MDA7877832.1 MotA/TolQ/ExbB proton channel family protein [Akkermansiaceae bacterium]MDA8960400.1 MotA/TolQ/ExbB proton channel family protein [Akkermansiaceae bacterium]MDB0056407.1 MotA/TolQ/ExbB proton channel family protein [Akkermansiaceae bacterium]
MDKDNGKKFALWGAWLQLGAVIGLLWTVVGMVGAFEKLSQSELVSSGALEKKISITLITAVIGIIPSFIGAVLMAVALFGKSYRAPWFFWFLIVYGLLLTMNFPVGTVLGGALIIYLIWKKNEFLASNSETGGAGSPATWRA